ncbi:unnamed protein product [Euphydryas editha]|uniref:Tyrosine-protein phosphatase domain-containing protein n=1 Tax=Euphydryas editha TaxID=104508 RepID=A0AAU9TQ55_EUPED|nr:unnamed protein product [Euphydryas editha]
MYDFKILKKDFLTIKNNFFIKIDIIDRRLLRLKLSFFLLRKDEDTYKIDLIIPARIAILKHTNIGPNEKKEESVEYLPMNLKCDHPIAKLVSTNPDRHIVMTIIPDFEKILLLKGITGSEKYHYTISTTYRVHNIKWLDDIIFDGTSKKRYWLNNSQDDAYAVGEFLIRKKTANISCKYYTQLQITIKNIMERQSRKITHLQYHLHYLDELLSSGSAQLISFLEMVNKNRGAISKKSASGPIVIHSIGCFERAVSICVLDICLAGRKIAG